MVKRILSGAVLILLLAAVVLFDQIFPLALNIVLAGISALSLHELVKAIGFEKKLFISIPAIATAAIVPFVVQSSTTFLVLCLYTAVFFISLLMHHQTVSFNQLAVVYSMVIIIPLALRTLVDLRTLGGGNGMFYVLIAILAAWVADAGAYFTGTLFGKHKLSPGISEKKTVEGAIGGFVVNIVVMLFCGYLYAVIFNGGEKSVNYIMLAVIGFVAGFTSILGDLSFSLIKRSCHIKDYGNVIPGHGGILDRFDSVIFTAPAIFLLLSYFPLAV